MSTSSSSFPKSGSRDPSELFFSSDFSGLQAELIRTFSEATIETFQVQFGIPVQVGEAVAKSNEKSSSVVDGQIAGVISIVEPRLKGNVCLLLSESLFKKAMTNLMGETVHEITEEVEDGAAEMMNIIFGIVKARLNSQGFAMDTAIPTLVRGRQIRLWQRLLTPPVIVPCVGEGDPFYIEFALQPRT